MWIKRIIKKIIYRERAYSDTYVEYLRRIGVEIGDGTTFIDPKTTTIDETRPWMISIGEACCITGGVTVLSHDYGWSVIKAVYGDVIGSVGKVSIGNNVYIGMHSTILSGVHIGNNVIIGANTLVSKDIPDNVVVVGNPARIVRSLEDYYKKRKGREFEEAIEMVSEYINKYGTDPSIEVMREHFWLFEDDYEKLHPEFQKVMKLVDGSYELTCKKFKKHKKMFKDFSDFLEFVHKQK